MTRLIPDQASSVVRERDRRRLRAMAGMIAVGGVLVMAVLGYVGLQVQRVRVSYELDALRSARTRLEEQNRKLQLELASLRAFARVDSAARRLGLTQPTPSQVQLAREYVAAPETDARGASLRTAARDELGTTARP
jgi:cell division protein FtsL